MDRDYDDAPEPHIVFYDPNSNLNEIKKKLLNLEKNYPRIVLQSYPTIINDQTISEVKNRMITWSKDSVGSFELSYFQEMKRYSFLPSVKTINRNEQYVNDVLQGMRICQRIFEQPQGNRSCFQICD
jgi:hypothetical protein